MKINELKTIPKDVMSHVYTEQIYDQCLIKLESYGFKSIGSGAFGVVFEHPNLSYVLKIFSFDTAYTNYINLCQQFPQNPYFPKFRGKLIQVVGDIIGAVRMEKLLPCLAGKNQQKLLTSILCYLEGQPGGYETLRVTETLDTYDLKLIPTLNLIKNWNKKFNYWYDIKPANIMRRRNGQLVFTDPVAAFTDPVAAM